MSLEPQQRPARLAEVPEASSSLSVTPTTSEPCVQERRRDRRIDAAGHRHDDARPGARGVRARRHRKAAARTRATTAAVTVGGAIDLLAVLPAPEAEAHRLAGAFSTRRPSASSTGEGSSAARGAGGARRDADPLEVQPHEHQFPSAPAKPTFVVPGTRGAPLPCTRAPGMASSRASQRARAGRPSAGRRSPRHSARASRQASPKPTMPDQVLGAGPAARAPGGRPPPAAAGASPRRT